MTQHRRQYDEDPEEKKVFIGENSWMPLPAVLSLIGVLISSVWLISGWVADVKNDIKSLRQLIIVQSTRQWTTDAQREFVQELKFQNTKIDLKVPNSDDIRKQVDSAMPHEQ